MQLDQLKRREFISLLGGAAAAWPLPAHAQRSGVSRIGFLNAASPAQFIDAAFREGLREAGFIEGQNVTIEYRWAKGAYERLPALAAELVELRIDLLAALGTSAVHVAKSATATSTPTIPVVFAMGSDPVAEGFVESLSRPGGNMTGITSIAGSLAPKRLELMREFLRDDAPIGILINPANPLSGAERQDAEAASRSIGQRLEVFTASNQAEIEQAFAALKQRRISVLIIAVDTFYYTQMQRMATLAAQARIPIKPMTAVGSDSVLRRWVSTFRIHSCCSPTKSSSERPNLLRLLTTGYGTSATSRGDPAMSAYEGQAVVRWTSPEDRV